MLHIPLHAYGIKDVHWQCLPLHAPTATRLERGSCIGKVGVKMKVEVGVGVVMIVLGLV